ncbi:unnamed protein product [Gordionus sp. m RMFG-2023]
MSKFLYFTVLFLLSILFLYYSNGLALKDTNEVRDSNCSNPCLLFHCPYTREEYKDNKGCTACRCIRLEKHVSDDNLINDAQGIWESWGSRLKRSAKTDCPLCGLYCQYGHETGEGICPLCKCKPKPMY